MIGHVRQNNQDWDGFEDVPVRIDPRQTYEETKTNFQFPYNQLKIPCSSDTC